MTGSRLATFRGLVVAIALTSGLAACGSSSSSTGPGPATGGQPSGQTEPKAQYVVKADAICRSAQEQLKPIQAKAKQEGTNHAALAGTIDQVASISSATLTKLRALPPPAGDHRLADRYLAAIAVQIARVRELANAVLHNNEGAVGRITRRINQGGLRVHELARAYGFKVCANPGG